MGYNINKIRASILTALNSSLNLIDLINPIQMVNGNFRERNAVATWCPHEKKKKNK